MSETWRPIPGFPGYGVSDKGRVRSYWLRIGSCARSISKAPQRILKGAPGANGYPFVLLSKNRTKHGRTVHSLVTLAFLGPRPYGLEVCHKDGDQTNNHLENLRYDSRAANMRDASAHGRLNKGRRLSSAEARTVRFLRADGWSISALSSRYSMTTGCISEICLGRTYKNIGGPIMQPRSMYVHDRVQARTLVDPGVGYETGGE